MCNWFTIWPITLYIFDWKLVRAKSFTFTNQTHHILTCVSVKLKLRARFSLSHTERYRVVLNLFSRETNCSYVNAVRALLSEENLLEPLSVINNWFLTFEAWSCRLVTFHRHCASSRWLSSRFHCLPYHFRRTCRRDRCRWGLSLKIDNVGDIC